MIIIDYEIGKNYLDTVGTLVLLETSPALEPVYLNSQGGSIAVAEAFAEKMKKVPRTCYVKQAQSAALQIVMPACKIVYASRLSIFGPHSAHRMFPKNNDMYSAQDLASLAKQLFDVSHNMAMTMIIKYGRDAICPKMQDPMLYRFSKTCIGRHMIEAKTFNTEAYNQLWGNPPIAIILPEEQMPKPQKPTGL